MNTLSKLAALKAKAALTLSNSSPSESNVEIPKENIQVSQTNSNSTVSTNSSNISSGNQISEPSIGILDSPITSSSVSLNSNEVSFAHLEFKSKLQELQDALLSAHPTMPVLLRDIHKQLKSDPEIVTLLSDDEIGVIVNGLKKQTQTELSGTTAKKVGTSKKVSLSADMF